jgi:hypothetical protein
MKILFSEKQRVKRSLGGVSADDLAGYINK